MFISNLNKELHKHDKKRSLRKLRRNMLKYLVQIPLHYTVFLPLTYISNKSKEIKYNYYRNKFELVERKAMEEMKKHVAAHLSSVMKECAITETKTYDRDEDICVKGFLQNEYIDYRSKGRKYARLYGKLFPDQIEKNHLDYMNELVIYMLDGGCKVKHIKIWSGNSQQDVLLGTIE